MSTDLAERVLRLEASNRRLSRVLVATSCAFCALVLLGQAAPKKKPASLVEARAIAIVDAKGEVRGFWGALPDGTVSMSLGSSETTGSAVRLAASPDGKVGLALTDAKDVARLELVANITSNDVGIIARGADGEVKAAGSVEEKSSSWYWPDSPKDDGVQGSERFDVSCTTVSNRRLLTYVAYTFPTGEVFVECRGAYGGKNDAYVTLYPPSTRGAKSARCAIWLGDERITLGMSETRTPELVVSAQSQSGEWLESSPKPLGGCK